MKPVWFDDGDKPEFICCYANGRVSVGNIDTITKAEFDAVHYGDPTMRIMSVWRMVNGQPVQGRIVLMRCGRETTVSVFGSGKSMPLWARGTWLHGAGE